MRIILFGTGKYYRIWKHSFDFCEIVAVLDNNKSKQGQWLDGHLIEEAECISKYEYEYVFILVKDCTAIYHQLEREGVSESKVLSVESPGSFRLVSTSISFLSESGNKGKHILILSHSLDLTGAPLVLLDMVMILHKKGCQVHVISPNDGPLREQYMRASISVTLVEGLMYLAHQIDTYIEWADTIVFNTLVLYPLVMEYRSSKKDMIWWLHEEENYYGELKIGSEQKDSLSDVRVYGVGNRVIRSFLRHFPRARIHELLYGVREEKLEDKDHSNVVFAFIGEDDYRKGGDIFRSAISQMQELTTEQCEYWIIGSVGKEKEEEFKAIHNAKLLGSMSHEDVMKLYVQIDIVVCPSRNDPMPVVVTEGMMMGKICIVSEAVGQVGMLTDGIDALICHTNDADNLCDKMKWALENRECWKEMGMKARRIYKKYFSMEQFEKNVSNLMEC